MMPLAMQRLKEGRTRAWIRRHLTKWLFKVVGLCGFDTTVAETLVQEIELPVYGGVVMSLPIIRNVPHLSVEYFWEDKADPGYLSGGFRTLWSIPATWTGPGNGPLASYSLREQKYEYFTFCDQATFQNVLDTIDAKIMLGKWSMTVRPTRAYLKGRNPTLATQSNIRWTFSNKDDLLMMKLASTGWTPAK